MRPPPQTSNARQHGLTAGILLGLVVAACAVGYLVLRVPAAREGLLQVTPHRLQIEKAAQRRLLAPRSVLMAGMVGGGVLGLCLLHPRLRAGLRERIPRGRRAVTLLLAGQSAVALAVVINLHAYYLRQYGGKPVWAIPEEAVLQHDLPQLREDGLALKARFPQGARMALRVAPEDAKRGLSHPFMLHAWAYPVALFDVWPKTEDWRQDPEFVRAVERHGIEYLVEYHQSDRANPLRVEALEARQTSGEEGLGLIREASWSKKAMLSSWGYVPQVAPAPALKAAKCANGAVEEESMAFLLQDASHMRPRRFRQNDAGAGIPEGNGDTDFTPEGRN